MKNKIIQTSCKWLSMNSTWRGIVLIATALGATLNPEQWRTIVEFGIGTAGVLLVSKSS